MIDKSSKQFKEMYEQWQQHCRYIQETTSGIFGTEEDKKKRIKRSKKDYAFFVNEYFPHYVFDAKRNANIPCADFHIDWANDVKKDDNFYGIAEWPREHAKSTHNTIFLPLWLKIDNKLDGMMLGGKSSDDACRLLGDVQAELCYNQRFINDFGEQYNEGHWEDGDFMCKDGTFFVALGRGQSPRGMRKGAKRPNYGVLDDIDDDEIVNNQDRVSKVIEWILGGFIGALNIKSSRFVMCGNRIHPKSILAHMVGDVEEEDPKREGYNHSKIFATTNGELDGEPTWYQNFKKEDLQRRFKRVGSFMALREYFHKYILKGKRFKQEWFHWDKVPALDKMDALVCYFDPSYKPKTTSDYKAIVFWGKLKNKFYRIDCFVKQTSITQAVKWMYDLYSSLPAGVIVDFYMEDVFLQDQFFEDFEIEGIDRGYILPIRGDKRDKPDKFARIESMTAFYERGNMIWNEEKRKLPDMQTSYLQYMGFEKGSSIHDDAPDADEGAIYILNRKVNKNADGWELGERENGYVW